MLACLCQRIFCRYKLERTCWSQHPNFLLEILVDCPWILKQTWGYIVVLFSLANSSSSLKNHYHKNSVILQVRSNSYRKAIRRIEALESLFDKHDIAKSPLIEQKLKVLHMKHELTAKIKSIKKQMRSSTELAFKDELKARKRVLRRLG